MKKKECIFVKVYFSIILGLFGTINIAMATGSTQIWIPSTDIQSFKTVHLGIDN